MASSTDHQQKSNSEIISEHREKSSNQFKKSGDNLKNGTVDTTKSVFKLTITALDIVRKLTSIAINLTTSVVNTTAGLYDSYKIRENNKKYETTKDSNYLEKAEHYKVAKEKRITAATDNLKTSFNHLKKLFVKDAPNLITNSANLGNGILEVSKSAFNLANAVTHSVKANNLEHKEQKQVIEHNKPTRQRKLAHNPDNTPKAAPTQESSKQLKATLLKNPTPSIKSIEK